MAPSNTINLIRTKTSSSPQVEAIEASLRRSGYIGIILFLSVGLLIGVLYLLFSAEQSTLESQRQEYARRVDSDRQTEGFFRSIKDRTRIVGKTLTSQRPWSQLLDEVSSFATPPVLSGLAVDDQNKITVTVNAGSIDTILPIVNSLIAEAQSNHLVNPQLESFQISKTGGVVASFSFSAVF